jgi:hypothetical protein
LRQALCVTLNWENKGVDELGKKKYIGFVLGFCVVIFLSGFVLNNPIWQLMRVIMWLTQYILPWIFLYYFIQFYKHYAQKQEKPPE